MNTYNNLVTIEDFQNYYEEDYTLLTKFNQLPTQYKKNHGICFQYDKPVDGQSPIQYYLPTQYTTGEEGIYYKDWNDNKNHRTKQKKCKYQKQDFYFSNYLEALDAVNNYRQIFTGLNHNRKDIIVLDVDEEFEEEHLNMVENICKIYDIPHFNYLLINDRTRHFQIGWFFDKPFYRETIKGSFPKKYVELRNALNRLFFGDIHFGNVFIKNPCCQREMTTFWYDINSETLLMEDATISPVNRDDFAHSVLIAFENTFGMSINEYLAEEKAERAKAVKERCNLSEEAVDRLIDYTFAERDTSDISSRHTYSFKYATEDCFRYMNTNNGSLPPIDWLMGRIIDLQKEAITYLNDPNRTTVEDMSKISSTAHFILEFCRDRWQPNRGKEFKNYDFGNLIHKIESFIAAYKYKKLREEHNNRITSAMMCITEQTGSKYNKMDINEIVDTLTDFYKEHHNDCGFKVKGLCEEIGSILYIEEDQYDDLFEEYAAIYSNPYLDRRAV